MIEIQYGTDGSFTGKYTRNCGMPSEGILPALLISNNHPAYFYNNDHGLHWGKALINENNHNDMKLIIIPFRKFCKTSTEVVNLMLMQ
jgi:hypothetical protein